ncbi:hypothetical protein HDZ31DRAFT_32543 [Schizophyllum fasciatum]
MLLSLLLATIPFLSLAALSPQHITHLVTFGDSYTDVDGGWNGGTAWPTYAAQYASATRGAPVVLHPFARSGAVCSTSVTASVYPSVLESQLPAYFASVENGTVPEGAAADITLYTLWVGTNDVGAWGLLEGRAVGEATVVDTVHCAVDWVRRLYERGARNFLWLNMIPLALTPIYSPQAYPNKFTPAVKNATERNIVMKGLTTAGNKLGEFFLKDLVLNLDGAHVGLFDSHALFTDMYAHPDAYLNGTAPLNVTGAAYACVYEDKGTQATDLLTCTMANGTDRDSYLWWDELHPSEQAGRVLAEQISQVILGEENKWTMWLS